MAMKQDEFGVRVGGGKGLVITDNSCLSNSLNGISIDDNVTLLVSRSVRTYSY